MEKNSKILNLTNFFGINSLNCSYLFVKLFKQSIKEIKLIKDENKLIKVFCKLNFEEDTSNYLNIVHGGAVAILIENLSNMILYYINKKAYKTKDISIIYKRQILLDKEYTLILSIDKIQYKTIFIQCILVNLIHEEQTIANIIKELEPSNKI